MKIQTGELQGAALDWAVAKCMTGGELFQAGRIAHAVVLHSVGGTVTPYFISHNGVIRCAFEPSTDWAQAGPIIEREGLCLNYDPFSKRWNCSTKVLDSYHADTPLVAAMRCFVVGKLGDEVETPEELV
jgi:hypothetical protein